MRKILVTTQFVISSALIIGICVIYQQLHFMQTKDLGFDKDQLLILPIHGNPDAGKKMQIKSELIKNTSIKNVTLANYVPGNEAYENQDMFVPEGKAFNQRIPLWYINSDFDLVKTLKLELVSGRDFDNALASDSMACIINEAAAAEMGWNARTATGKKIYSFSDDNKERTSKTVIGVVKNFHFENFSTPIKPMLLGINKSFWWNFIVRLNPAHMDGTIAFVKEKLKVYQPSQPFEYHFVDENFNQFWKNEQRLVNLTGLFTVLAVFIACLGLFALSIFVTRQRVKEIGIRRTLGAGVSSILKMLTIEFLKPVVIAFCIAMPLSWWMMHRWLEDFVYRIDIRWTVFIAAGLIAMSIAFMTVIVQSLNVASRNPVKSLRIE